MAPPATDDVPRAAHTLRYLVRTSGNKPSAERARLVADVLIPGGRGDAALRVADLLRWGPLFLEFALVQRQHFLDDAEPQYGIVAGLVRAGLRHDGQGSGEAWAIDEFFARFILRVMARLGGVEWDNNLVWWLVEPRLVTVDDCIWILYHTLLFLHLEERWAAWRRMTWWERAAHWIRTRRCCGVVPRS